MLQLSTIDPIKSKLNALVIPVAEDNALFSDRRLSTLLKKIKALFINK